MTPTSLSAGSAAIIQYQEDTGVTWSIVLLEDIEAGTTFSFTDNGWKANGTFRVGESDGITFTATQALTAGTVITFTNTGAVLAGTNTSVGTMTGDPIDLSEGGSNGRDQIFMYQGSFDTTTGVVSNDFQFITAYHANGAWNSDATDNRESALPQALTMFSVDQSDLGQDDNAVYNGPTSGTIGTIWSNIRDQNNWIGTGNPTTDPYSTAFNNLGDFSITLGDPTVTTPSGLVFETDSTGNAIVGLSVDDPDDTELTVTLTAEGTLSLGTTTGLTFIQGDGTDDSTLEVFGTIANLNAALATLTYSPAMGDVDGDMVMIAVTDGTRTISEGTFAASTDLSTLNGTNGFFIEGLAAIDRLGYDVANAGDINGDGIDDIIIGAPYAESGVTLNTGEAYVIYGTKAPFSAEFDLTTLDGTNGFKIVNEAAGYLGDELGHAVTGLGDINGDGFDDFAVGSFNANKDNGQGGVTNDVGKSWIVFGTGANQPATLDVSTLNGTNGFTVTGDRADDYAGRVVTSAGDINGDGINDILIGADRTDTNGNNSGGAYVIYGVDSTNGGSFAADIDLLTIQNGDGSVGTYIIGEDQGDRAGRDVHAAGDINGDGFDDIIIGSYEFSQQATDEFGNPLVDGMGAPIIDENIGKAHVVYGNANGLGATLDLGDLDGSDGFEIAGLDAGDKTGRGVSSAGDINGDGIDDIIIGAYEADANGNNSGKLYVIYGVQNGLTAANFDLTTLDGTNGFVIEGENGDARTGFDVSDLGDVNGDGIDDVLIGSISNFGRSNGSYVLFGSDTGFSATVDLGNLDGTDGFQLPDAVGGDFTGFSVSGAGDLNGDGVNDLIVGAASADPNMNNNSGKAYVIFGNANIVQSFTNASFAIELEQAPVIADLDGDAATFTEGDTIALLDQGTALAVTDADSADLDGGTLDIQYTAGQLAEDTLVIDTTGTVTLSAGQTAGSIVSVGGTAIGTIAAGETGASGEGLQIALNNDATPALVTTLLQAIGYANTAGDTPDTTAPRSLSVTLSDGDGADTSVATTITVVAVDNAPVITPPVGQSFAVNSTGNLITGLSVSDVDSASLTVTLTVEGTITLAQTTGLTFDAGADGTSTMTISGATGDVNAAIATLTYVPATDDRDGDSLAVTVTDGTTPVGETVVITLTNSTPTLADDAISANEDGPATTGDVLADNGNGADSDPNGDTLTVSEVNGEAGDVGQQITLASGALLTVNGNGTFSYDANGAFEALDETQTGTDSFGYTVDDGFGGTASATATVTVQGANDAAVITAPGAQSVLINSTGNTIAGLSFADVDDTSLTVTLSAEGTISLAQTTGLAFTTGDGADDTTMTFSGTTADVNAAVATLTYAPATDDSDGDTISISVNDGTDVSAGSIAITQTNLPPVAENDAFSVAETGTLMGNVLADNGSGADTDGNGDQLTVAEVNGQASDVGQQVTLTSGALLTLNSDGTFDYDPNGAFDSLPAGQNGSDSFVYTLSDGRGGSDTATVTLTITGENDAPLGADDAFTLSEDGTLAAESVLADNGNGADSDPNTDPITVTEVNGVAASVGQQITLTSGALLTLSANGTFDYDPNGAFDSLAGGQNGADSFVYTIDDGLGGTDTATVSLTLTGANDAPVETVPGAQSFLANSAGNTLTGISIADPDDATLLVTLSAEGTFSLAQTTGLTFILGDGTDDSAMAFNGSLADINDAIASLTYTPNVGDRDGDSLSIGAFDGDVTTSQSIAINLENADPIGSDDAFSIGDTAASVSGSLLADNGNGADSDANGDTLSITELDGQAASIGALLTLASGATLQVNSDGTFAFNSNNAYQGLLPGQSTVESFTYTVDDGFGGTDTATLSITIVGSTEGNDVFFGTGAADVFSGENGDDRLFGNGGNDTLSGGGGIDDIFGGEGADAIFGGSEADNLYGEADNDVISGDAGNDNLFGEEGADTLLGGTGDDRLDGGAGVDMLYGGGDADTLLGGDDGDFLFGEAGNDTLRGHDGEDRLDGGTGEDDLFGGADADRLFGGGDADRLFGDGGNDVLRGEGGGDRLDGGLGDDDLFGGNAADRLFGGAGNDDLFGEDGFDVIFGGDDADNIYGGTGNDILYGDNGSDFLFGQEDNDFLFGGAGIDRLDGGAGSDSLYGGSEGDTLLGGGDNDFLFGEAGADILRGQGGNDRLDGGEGADELYGGDDNDILLGRAGDDLLFGDGGNDSLSGGAGNDRLEGGSGVDTYVFRASEAGSDTVIGFEAGELVELNGFGYANASAAAADFTQVGNDVVFSNGAVSATFRDAQLADVTAGISVSGSPAQSSFSGGPVALSVFDFADLGATSGPIDPMVEFEVLQAMQFNSDALGRVGGVPESATLDLDIVDLFNIAALESDDFGF